MLIPFRYNLRSLRVRWITTRGDGGERGAERDGVHRRDGAGGGQWARRSSRRASR